MCCSLACCCVLLLFSCALLLSPIVVDLLDAPPVVREVAFDEVERSLPLADGTFPRAFRGILWMDQGGSYAHSDVPMSAPDLALSFGASTWDPTTRSLEVDCAGPSWSWMNTLFGRAFFRVMRLTGYFYYFELSTDEQVIQIYPSLNLGPLGKVHLPRQILSFTMEKLEGSACPPARGASRRDVAKCAQWDRVSTGLLSPLFGSFGVVHYYVFQIVDGDGKRVQPYYDEYLKFAAKSCSPPGPVSSALGFGAARCPTFFTGQGMRRFLGDAATGAQAEL